MDIPSTNLYLESNQNTTFPYQAANGTAIDVSGDGTSGTKSGGGGATASTAGAMMNAVPIASSFMFICLLMMGLSI